MQVEQKNIWEDVTRNVKRDNSNRAIAAYQANMPDAERLQLLADRKPMCSRKLRCPRLEISIWQRIPIRQSRGRKKRP